MMKLERKGFVNYLYIIVIVAILFSNLFSHQLSIFLKLIPNYTFRQNTEVHFINVGQGDAIAIKFANGKTMLIDSGTNEYRRKLTTYLDAIVLDSKTIDYLVLTHIDSDHSSNISYILNNYNVKAFYRPPVLSSLEDKNSKETNDLFDDIVAIAKSKDIEMFFNSAEITLEVGSSKLLWLSPINIQQKADIESNEYSPVIKLEHNNHSVLLTGDISEDVEKELIDKYAKQELDVDILKLAHHGSRYSTSKEFLEVTSPDYACVCVGENTYGHPSNYTFERILEYDKTYKTNLFTNLYSTKEDGNIIFELGSQINVNIISNIDDYNFVDYYIYSLIAILFLLYFFLKPYSLRWRKDIRFIVQNKRFKKYLEKEKNRNLESEKN